MAIVELTKGSFGPVTSAAGQQTFTTSIPLVAGSNRLFLMAVIGQCDTPPTTFFHSPRTLGGQTLANISDGVNGASRTSTNVFQGSIFWYLLTESQLQRMTPGSQTLTIGWSPSSGVNFTYYGHWWLVGGAEQPSPGVANVANVFFASSISSGVTAVIATRSAGLATDAVFWAAMCRPAAGQILTLRLDAAPVTADFADVENLFAFRTGSAKTLAAPTGAGTVEGVFNASANQIALVSGFRFRSFVAPVPGDVTMTLKQPWSVDAGWTR